MDEQEIRKNFGENLSRLRKYNKLSQQDLANKLSYSDKAISKWELGDNIPDVITLERIAELFNVTVDELIKPSISVSKSGVTRKKRLMVTILASGLGLFLGIVGLLVLSILKFQAGITGEIIDKFIYCCYPLAFFAGSVITIVLTVLWFEKIWQFIAITTCIWSSAVVAMIWLDFNIAVIWIIILIGFIANALFYFFLKITK